MRLLFPKKCVKTISIVLHYEDLICFPRKCIITKTIAPTKAQPNHYRFPMKKPPPSHRRVPQELVASLYTSTTGSSTHSRSLPSASTRFFFLVHFLSAIHPHRARTQHRRAAGQVVTAKIRSDAPRSGSSVRVDAACGRAYRHRHGFTIFNR